MAIVFRREKVESALLDPRHGFARIPHQMEFRYDPLTGRSSRLAHFGAIRPQPLALADYDGESRGFCPFCPPNLEKVTSLFPPEIIPEGRLRRGEAVLIANIAPYDQYSGLVVVSDRHVLALEDLTADRLRDALGLGINFLCRIRQHAPQIPYFFMGWNYMPPSGGGLVHPHIQVFGGRNPGNYYLDALAGARKYWEENGRPFWPDYLEEERRLGERYLGETGGVYWLVPFAPLGIIGDVLAVIPEASTAESITPAVLDALLDGFTRLLGYFRDKGIHSFNASFHFTPAGEEFPVLVRFTPRTFLNTKYFPPDTNFFQVVLQQPICVVWPEEISREISAYFA